MITEWKLDNLGNWSGGDATTGSMVRSGDLDGDGFADPDQKTHHDTDTANQVNQVYLDGAVDATIVSDPNGNVASDGVNYYQYDAWNRLVQVNLIGTAVLTGDGQIDSGTLGGFICRYSYDGLGRQILAACIGPRLRLSQDFPYLPLGVVKRPGDRPNAHPLPMGPTNPTIIIHRKHPSPPILSSHKGKQDAETATVGPICAPISIHRVGPFCAPITSAGWARRIGGGCGVRRS